LERKYIKGINMELLYLSAIVVAIAIITKLEGCGLSSILFLRDKNRSMKIGIGMISRGEVRLIVAAVGITSGALHLISIR
jgi:Kef-type K+ transport system membrane component KefB